MEGSKSATRWWGRKEIEVLKTDRGVVTDRQQIAEEFCMYFLPLWVELSNVPWETIRRE